jgi:CBS domain-containing protein
MNLDLFKVNSETPLKNAMAIIDKNQFGAVFATDNFERVIGVITDGDIRRFLLAGNSIDAPTKMCLKPNFVHASTRDSRTISGFV